MAAYRFVGLLVLTLLALGSGAAPVAGQDVSATLDPAARTSLDSLQGVAPGDRIRVSMADTDAALEGTLVGTSDGWMKVERSDGGVARIPADRIVRFERHSRVRNFWKHFARVEIAGSLGGGLLTAIAYQTDPCEGFCIGPSNAGEAFLMGAVAGAVVSLPVATLFGLVLEEDRWTEVPGWTSDRSLLDRVDLGVSAGPVGVSFGASIALGGGV